MKNNPCRYCYLSTNINGRHMASYRNECKSCKNRISYEQYLHSQRKFIRGEQINDISRLLECEWLMLGNTTKHIEIFKSMQLRTVLGFINSGRIYEAIRKTENDIND